MDRKLRDKLLMSALGWLVAALIFFPIFWMFLTSFKTEVDAVTTPPSLFFTPSLENYIEVQARANYVRFALNSVVISLVATLLVGGTVLFALARLFPSSPFGRRLLIPAGALPGGSVATPTGSGAVVSPAREGTAMTPLRPAGTARLGDSLVDVVTEGDFVDAGARVRVVRVEGSRVVVRPVAG